MSDQFNSDYYITIATVVPLLYITLFLQGQLMQDLTKRIGAANGKQVVAALSVATSWSQGEFKLIQIWTLAKAFFYVDFFFSLFIYILAAIVLAGPVAAGYAIWALFWHSDVFYMRMITMLSAMGLILLVIAAPTVVVLRNTFMPLFKMTKEYVDAVKNTIMKRMDAEDACADDQHETLQGEYLG
jgi:hypothetical protein